MSPDERKGHDAIFNAIADLENIMSSDEEFKTTVSTMIASINEEFQRRTTEMHNLLVAEFNKEIDGIKAQVEDHLTASKNKISSILLSMENTLPDEYFEDPEKPAEEQKPKETIVAVVEDLANGSEKIADIEGKVTGKTRYDWMSILAYTEEILETNGAPMAAGDIAMICMDKGYVLSPQSLKTKMGKSARFQSLRKEGWTINPSGTPIRKLMKDYGLR